ncbi:MAG: NAD(P)/FAD-dependent oxidoreductase [Candidatus Doudnabacteria bacterium]|nr:NAD(P)/FAD-dependent oxidoreductase [Candidatus Doudnabacteria bacterium]
MKKIVILGAGFGGLKAALGFEKKFRNNQEIEIVLIDKYNYHQFNPNLYEVATADEEFTSIKDLRLNTAMPIKVVLRGKRIKFVQGEVIGVDLQNRKVSLSSRQVQYNYLILATGSENNFMGIPGAKEFALPLKSIKDALMVRNQVAFAVESRRQDMAKRALRFVLAGGGYTGCELAAELPGLLDILAWKFEYPREKMEIEIVEATNQLLPGLDPALSKLAASRLRDLGVYIRLLSPVVCVERHMLRFLTGESVAYDILIWAAGVKAAPLPFYQTIAKDGKNRIKTNGYLQTENYDEVFIIGDECCVLDEDGWPAPATAQDAIHQAEYLTYALPVLMQNKRPNGFTCKKHGIIITLGGKWAIFKFGKYYFSGFWPYVLRKLANFRYYASILGWFRAIPLAVADLRVYSRND